MYVNKLANSTFFSIFSSFFLIIITLLVVLFWPEYNNLTEVLSALLFSIILCVFSSKDFRALFTISFVCSTFFAFIIFSLLSPENLFETAFQNPSASDSQFFLHEAREFIKYKDFSFLLSTWGSLIPVLYGAISIELFCGSFVGIIFFNCLLYSISIYFGCKILNINNAVYRFVPLLGLLPLPIFYNAMLSKEPIYLFFILSTFYLLSKITKLSLRSFIYLILVLFFLSLLFLYRPIGAISIILVIFIVAIVRLNFYHLIAFLGFLIFISSLLVVMLLSLSDHINYSIPLFFLSDTGSTFSINSAIDLQYNSAQLKNLPESLLGIITPPISILLSVPLGVIWLILPLPLITNFFDAILNIFFLPTFADFSILVRFFDSFCILLILIKITLNFKKVNFFCPPNPLMLFTIIQILGIVSFQFLESGRHRYVPGVILALILLSLLRKFDLLKDH